MIASARRMKAVGTALAASGLGLCVARPPTARADELSGADKLRALYSAEFRFTREGLPVVPVSVAEGLRGLTVSAEGGLRVLPEGEGGPEIRADGEWQVSMKDGKPARIRYWTVVWRGGPTEAAAAAAEVKAWKARGAGARAFEQGTLFGVAGEVLDRREILVAVGPVKTMDEAEKASDSLAKMTKTAKLAATGVYTELAERPSGYIEAVGAHTATRIRNEGVIWFAPVGDAPVRIQGLLPAAGGAAAKDAGRSYFGKIYVTIDRNGALAVVNAVPEDRLLAGLVPAEIFPSAPDEALKAQAVAARGELLAKIGTRHLADPYRLCSTTHCQVYSGAGKEMPRTTAAVKATQGEVLFTADARDLADTVYSANCGGHTENNENVWPDMHANALLRGRSDAASPAGGGTMVGKDGVTAANLAAFIDAPPDAWCRRAKLGAGDRYRWTARLAAADLARMVAPLGVGAVRAIEVVERGVSGRARALRIVGTKKTETVRRELRIRQTFGGLRSSLFLVDMAADGSATFRGAGFGHGVGLCQTGAVGMAEAGKSYQEILRHYYTGSVLRKLW